MNNTIFDEIKSLNISCPDCNEMYSDDQYTCTTCWCEGGQGTINVFTYLKNNINLLIDEED